MGASFDVSDINRLAASLSESGANTGKLVQTVVRKTAVDVKADAKLFAPYEFGHLKNSIGHSDLRTVGTSGTVEVEVGPTAEYGHWLEHGTSKMAPHAYLGPALDRRTPAFVDAMGAIAEEAASGRA